MFCASSRLRWGNVQPESPSMFLKEIDESHVEEIDLRFKSRFGGQFRFDNRQDSYRSGYGNGFGNSYTSHGNRYSANYVNTEKFFNRDQDETEGRPKPSEASRFNIRNMKSPVLIKKGAASAPAKPASVTYEVGDRIRSEFYGEGTISGKRQFAGREVLDVKFDSGRTGTFACDKVTFEKI